MLRGFRYRFYPTPAQAVTLRRTIGCCRLVYNKGLSERSVAWTERGESVSFAQQCRTLTQWKKQEDLAFLSEVSIVPLQQSLRSLKKRRHGGSARYMRNGFRWDKGQLTLAKMNEPLDIRWSRPLPLGAEPSSVTVRVDAGGRWFVSLLCDDPSVVRGMVRNRALSRAISDAGWSEFVSMLSYKCLWYGRTLVQVDRFYPSSKTCSACGGVVESLPLSVRSWHCPRCAAPHDRDHNAAKNILAAGLAVSACGPGVSQDALRSVLPSGLKQETSEAIQGIPGL